ncbi:MAG: ribosome silencing factor [Bacteroidetes bacterium]|nr:ribosome silencing factor [Bacteroidota bacterium]
MVKSAAARSKKPDIIDDALVNGVIKGLQDRKAKEIIVMDLRKIGGVVSDFFIVCQGDSSTQVEGIARSVEESVLEECGENPEHIEGVKNALWVLIDYISVVVHIFQPEQRDYYGIERLWADAEIIRITDNN